MTDDTPRIGLVIRHLYLWRDEAKRGQEQGLKARPCVIVHTRNNEFNETEVYVCPITHTKPHQSKYAVEIPLKTKQRLKLDDEQSWLITHELNRFIWKGPDVVKTRSSENAYGFLPHNLTEHIIQKLREHSKERTLHMFNRDDDKLNEQVRHLKQRLTDFNKNKK